MVHFSERTSTHRCSFVFLNIDILNCDTDDVDIFVDWTSTQESRTDDVYVNDPCLRWIRYSIFWNTTFPLISGPLDFTKNVLPRDGIFWADFQEFLIFFFRQKKFSSGKKNFFRDQKKFFSSFFFIKFWLKKVSPHENKNISHHILMRTFIKNT